MYPTSVTLAPRMTEIDPPSCRIREVSSLQPKPILIEPQAL